MWALFLHRVPLSYEAVGDEVANENVSWHQELCVRVCACACASRSSVYEKLVFFSQAQQECPEANVDATHAVRK